MYAHTLHACTCTLLRVHECACGDCVARPAEPLICAAKGNVVILRERTS